MKDNIPPIFAGKHDWLILLALLAVSLLAWAGHHHGRSDSFNGACRVRILTEPPQELVFNQAQPRPVEVKGRTGLAVIEWGSDKRIRISSSACPCKTCVNMGWTDSSSLICVPNGIIVEPLVNTGQKVDAVTR
ncbi:MAG: hypothetical protein CVV42_12415 [Candidatus Riflebacteria bacterium HGW-Riflebacteria-2]|jgi:hypothetical protein|nr:MAG: hypothetical protein CVV42_12415 [Candidatus Riflebacteria bacterium HGW-Riflebacteria-2]